MPFQIIRNDITKVKADAIVNTANPHPFIGGGTDSAIYAAAGEKELLEERKKIGDIAPGDVAVTPAFHLNAKYILHTVGPSWVDGSHGEQETLKSCYAKSLEKAAELSCESIAFPLIATGVYGFPKDEALNIALAEIGRFLLLHEMEVILVVFDRRALELSNSLAGSIREYIDEHEALALSEQEYRGNGTGRSMEIEERRRADLQRRRAAARPKPAQKTPSALTSPSSAFPDVSGKSLDEVLDAKGETFQQYLFKLIDASGLDDVTVYKRANIDRKVFSRIRCNVDYKPLKKTAVAFAIALRLDMPAMLELLAKGGFTFSAGDRFDLIVSYFITHKIYDIDKINIVLFQYEQPTLGSKPHPDPE